MSKSTTEKSGAENGFASVDTDDRYRVLASEERRIVLDTLEGEASTNLDELVAEVAASKSGTSTETQVRISLVHQHLPLLANAGVVTFDRETERITHSESALEEILSLL